MTSSLDRKFHLRRSLNVSWGNQVLFTATAGKFTHDMATEMKIYFCNPSRYIWVKTQLWWSSSYADSCVYYNQFIVSCYGIVCNAARNEIPTWPKHLTRWSRASKQWFKPFPLPVVFLLTVSTRFLCCSFFFFFFFCIGGFISGVCFAIYYENMPIQIY